MSSSSQTSLSSSQSEIIGAALSEFKKKTGKTLLDDRLTKELNNCNSVEAVMDVIQGQAKAFDKFKNGGSKLMKWIRSSVHVLFTISTTLGDGVGVVVPSAKAVFTGIGILLAAANDVWASHDVLVDLFERIQFFLQRLGVHTRISPTKDMVAILVKVMAEVFAILSIATKEMQQSRTKTYIKKLLGRTDIEDALKRLDNLTQEEVRMAIAQVLQGINVLIDDVKKANDAVREIKDGVEEIKWDQIERDVHKWFSPPDPSVNYNIAREAYQEGTAAWFFQGGIFKEWVLVGTLLWVHGKPGSGKSILSSAIIKHVISLRDAGDATLAYFFFDFRDKEKKQDTRNFLSSLLIQLSAHSDHCRKIIFDIYSKHGKGTQQPSIGALTKCLHDMIFVAAQRPVYLIIDALDECPNISGLPTPRTVLLGLLKDLVDLRIPNLHICVTSRPEFDIKNVLEPLAYSAVSLHEESGQKKDISDYVNTVVKSYGKMRRWRDVDQELVVEVLSERADGMFLWVYCQLEVLQHCIIASIRQILDQLPKSLDETYARVLSQIPQANEAHAHRLLQCLMVAVRPLRVEELAGLLAFEFDTTQGAIPRYRAGWQLNDQEQAVLSMCSSLIAIVDDNGSQVVQFSHFSVKEFLMSNRLGDFSQYQINPRPAHTVLVQACLGFFLHLDDHVDRDSVNSFPLAKYATEHWLTHPSLTSYHHHLPVEWCRGASPEGYSCSTVGPPSSTCSQPPLLIPPPPHTLVVTIGPGVDSPTFLIAPPSQTAASSTAPQRFAPYTGGLTIFISCPQRQSSSPVSPNTHPTPNQPLWTPFKGPWTWQNRLVLGHILKTPQHPHTSATAVLVLGSGVPKAPVYCSSMSGPKPFGRTERWRGSSRDRKYVVFTITGEGASEASERRGWA